MFIVFTEYIDGKLIKIEVLVWEKRNWNFFQIKSHMNKFYSVITSIFLHAVLILLSIEYQVCPNM